MLDITADQFGAPEIPILPASAALAWQADESICVAGHLADAQLEVLLEKAPAVVQGPCNAVAPT